MDLPTGKSLESLRSKAEKAIEEGYLKESSDFNHIKDYIHELQVYQVELEMQAEELRRTQVELELSRDEYSLLYDRAPVGYISISYSGIILKANKKFSQMVGSDSEGIYRKPLSKFICQKDHPLFYTVCKKAVESEQFHECELGFLRTDNTRFIARLDLIPQESTPGMEAHYKITVLDITEKKKAEEQKLRLETEILKFQKEDSLNRLAGGIAHNFNNLLSIIMGNIELVREADLGEEQAVKSLTNAYDASLKAAELSKMMLTYLGYPLSNTTTIDISQTIENLVSVIRSTLHGSIQLSLAKFQGPLRINGDPTQIAQILNNIIKNSVEAIGENSGAITVKVYEEAVTNKFSHPVSYGEKVKPGDYACIEIIDDGCGMDQETLQKAIEPFFTTNFTGRGLGLSAVWGSIRAHQGYLFLESKPESGTSVKILLPLLEIKATEISETAYTQQSGTISLDRKTILYVDDDSIVRTIGKLMLQEREFNVLEAGGGKEAVEIYQNYGDKISCVILDFAMPDQDGAITLVELRAINPKLPVLLVSGFLKEQAAQRFLTEKPDGFLQKPFSRDDFVKAIESILIY